MRVTHRLSSRSLSAIPAEASWAEATGYGAISKNENANDSFMALTLAATSTTRAMLQTSVAIAFPRSPMIVAYAARDLQDLSKGRFRLGLGTQVKGHIERRFSTSWESPGPRLREYVQALKAIWSAWDTGERLDYQGKHYSFTLMTPFFSPGPGEFPPPPVFAAAVNAYNCQVAGEVADGLMLHSLTSPEYIREVVRPALARGAERSGRDPDAVKVTGGGFLITGPNRASLLAARAEVRQRIAFYASTRTYHSVLAAHGFEEVGQRLHEMSVRGEWAEMGELVSDEMLDAFAVSGEYDEVAGEFARKYGGLLDEASFTLYSEHPLQESDLRRIVRDFREL